MSNEFDSFLKYYGIISQLSALRIPQQNRVAKKKNRTLMNMVRSMMSFLTLPTSFYGYALETTGYILNLVSSKLIPLTPMKMWIGCKPSLHHVRIQEYPTHVLKPKVDKLEPRD